MKPKQRDIGQMSLPEAQALLARLQRSSAKFGSDEKRTAQTKRVQQRIQELSQ